VLVNIDIVEAIVVVTMARSRFFLATIIVPDTVVVYSDCVDGIVVVVKGIETGRPTISVPELRLVYADSVNCNSIVVVTLILTKSTDGPEKDIDPIVASAVGCISSLRARLALRLEHSTREIEASEEKRIVSTIDPLLDSTARSNEDVPDALISVNEMATEPLVSLFVGVSDVEMTDEYSFKSSDVDAYESEESTADSSRVVR
jgi:hypothetical protein